MASWLRHQGDDGRAGRAIGREKNLMRWDMTVAEVFPDLTIHPKRKPLPLTHLITHRAGLPANLLWGLISLTGSLQEQRMVAVRQGLAAKTEKPDRKYL